jgi:hypothetical protein
MLMNRSKTSKEQGEVTAVAHFFFILVVVVAVVYGLLSAGAIISNNAYAGTVQLLLKVQGHDLTLDEVKELVGNKNELVAIGDRGPETTVELKEVGKVKVYLTIDQIGSETIEVLRNADDDSLVASPKLIPEDTKENW